MGQPAQANEPQSFADFARQAAHSHGFSLDSSQIAALAHFERLRDELTEAEQADQSLLRVFLRQRPVESRAFNYGRSCAMYAVIETGGKQYRVAQGDKLFVEKLDAEAGATVSLDKVLMLGEPIVNRRP